MAESTVSFIAVGTPPRENGQPDLTYVEDVARDIAASIRDYHLVVEKSTVPVQTGKWVRTTIERYNKAGGDPESLSGPNRAAATRTGACHAWPPGPDCRRS